MKRFRTAIIACFTGCLAIVLAVPAWSATSVTCSSPASARPEPTEYFVSLADPGRHLAHISIRLRDGSGVRTLDMPVWNAIYQVRDFAANIENVQAQGASGAEATVRKTKTSEWEITAPTGCVVVSYDIHVDVPGPFGSALDADHGFFNWAMVLMYSPSLRSQSMSIRLLDTPTTWEMRDLHVLGAAVPGTVDLAVGIAHNYDELVDSPVAVGTFQQSSFQQDGATYHIVVDGNPADYDMEQLDKTLAAITHAAVDWMQDRPYGEYTFLYHFPRGPGGGGMEHAYGTAIELNADRLRANLASVARVSSHEFFHLWNVKRIRPQSLEPIDYQHEMDTRALWFSEGVTSTVGDMLLARSGLIDESQYLRAVSEEITELQRRPARRWQSVEESSLDAWFEGVAFYRSRERSISYYNKGELLGILLDLRIRQLTNDTKSLRDLFQWMNQHYAKEHRYFPDSAGVEEAAEAITGQSFSSFFRDYVAGVKELAYDEFFQFAGLHVVVNTTQFATAGFTTSTNLGAQPEVVQIEANSDAQRLGLRVGDRVTASNGKPTDAQLDDELSRLPPGTTVRLQLENRRGKREVELRLGSRQEESCELQDVPRVTAEQRKHRTAWIHGDDEPGSAH
ncbi:MAG: PDZ domain-containing protein [Candidatus Korobacteraceae bacterium]